MNYLLHLIFFATFFGHLNCDCTEPSITTVSGTHAPTGTICPGDLIFHETFDTFDLEIWHHEKTLGGGGNGEFQWYTNNRTVSWVEDSNLFIRPYPHGLETGDYYLYNGQLDINGESPTNECTNPQFVGCLKQADGVRILNPVISAKIRTAYSFNFKYGKFEASAKAPAGDWTWPSIWLLPRDQAYGGWPASGEIDVVEIRGNLELYNSSGTNIGTHLGGCTLHWGPDYLHDKFQSTHSERLQEDGYNSAYHRYQVEWTPDHITFSIDDQVVGTTTPTDGGFWELGNLDESGCKNPWKAGSKMAPFDRQFYIIIQVAIGGTDFFPDGATNNFGKKPWNNTSDKAITEFWEGRDQWIPTWKLDTDDAAFKVDYVKVWAL